MKYILVFCAALALSLTLMRPEPEFYNAQRSARLAQQIDYTLLYGRARAAWVHEELEATKVPKPIHLGQILIANIYSGGREYQEDPESEYNYISAGEYAPDAHKKVWRGMLAKNPQLAYSAIDLFAGSVIESLNRKMLHSRDSILDAYKDLTYKTEQKTRTTSYVPVDRGNGDIDYIYSNTSVTLNEYMHYTEEGVNRVVIDGYNVHTYYNLKAFRDSLAQFKPALFWKRQLQLLNRYQQLTDKLLALDDLTLERLIYTTGKEQTDGFFAASDMHEFMVKNGFLSSFPSELYKNDDYTSYYKEHFPLDLILLTYRSNIDFPEWTYRRFLTEARKVAFKLKPILEKAAR